jgi:hypothetical protein
MKTNVSPLLAFLQAEHWLAILRIWFRAFALLSLPEPALAVPHIRRK